ncbi:ABC-2 type transport system permease protein [Microterricola gilva]|uniref:Transport permease protein n=1 Tax=Microterricola gilva TaxID=393267 RepID=A0A4Q8AJ26_9MICO|nr:ABC transporter permease [Microterricola gilva]RZU64348.1 ABC-2 type transport system permease protein [Microterricola gilva]
MTAQDRFAALSQEKLVTVGSGSASGRGFFKAVREIIQHREMLGLLVRRDLKSRYKDSTLGFVWSLIRPLTQLLIYYVVIGKFLSAERGIPDFAIFVFTGLTAFGLISEMIGGGTASIVGNSGLIKKIYLPREVFPLASAGSALFNFAIQMGILLLATLALNAFPLGPGLIYLIPAILVLVVYGMAFGLLLAAVNVYLRDVQYLVEVLLMLLMWASPIVYSWGMVKDILGDGTALAIYTNNPITLAVLGFQRALWTAGDGVAEYPPDLMLRLGIAFVVGAVLLAVFHRVFAKLQGNFAQAL